MKHLFVPYEIALLLKEKGYNIPCFAYYTFKEFRYWIKNSGEEYDHCANQYFNNNEVAAPLYQQVVDWFREAEGFYIEVVRYDVGHFEWVIKSNMAEENSPCTYPDYYEALTEAIIHAIKLI